MTTFICQDQFFDAGAAPKSTAIISFISSLMPSERALGSD